MRTYYLVLSVLVFALYSCGGAQNKVESKDAQVVASGEGARLVVDTTLSVINWTGFKVGGSHQGTLGIKSGDLIINDSTLVSGTVVLDMNKIINTDLTDAGSNAQLVGHLKSTDFFDVEKYSEGKFDITAVEKIAVTDSVTHRISGNLTLKDQTKNVTFDAKITKEGDMYKAVTVPFAIDRTQWGVNYASKTVFADLKDKIINDDMQIQITIVAKAAK